MPHTLFQLPKFVKKRYRVPHQSKFIMVCVVNVITIHIYVRDSSQSVSQVSMYLTNESRKCLRCGLSFQAFLYSCQVWERKSISLRSKRPVCLLPIIKDFEFPKLGVLQLNATCSGFRCVIFFKICCENQGLREGCKC